jgi:hypothetical protein
MLWLGGYRKRKRHHHEVRDFWLFQIHKKRGRKRGMITGTIAGSSSTFKIGFVPATNFVPLQEGPEIAADDPKVTLSAVDNDNMFTASIAADDTAVSYNLTVTGVNGAGVAITHTFNVPILPPPPPPSVQITDFSLDQVL